MLPRKLISLFASLLILLIGSLGMQASADISTQDFTQLFPEAHQDGACYVLRLDGCEVVAVINSYSGSSVSLIFVTAEKKSAAMRVAQKLAKALGQDCYLSPFVGPEPSVAIMCPITGVSYRSPLSAILYPISVARKSVQFVSLNGHMLKARTEYRPVSTLRKKNRGTVEVTVDISRSSNVSTEFRTVKGRLEEYDIRGFISERMWGSAYSKPDFNAKEKAAFRSDYPMHDLVSYSESSDFCIVSKGKVYRAGTLKGVSNAIKSKEAIAKFDFPAEDSSWPGVESSSDHDTSRIAQADTAPKSDTAKQDAPKSEKLVVMNTVEPASSRSAASSDAASKESSPLPSMYFSTKEHTEALDSYLSSLKRL